MKSHPANLASTLTRYAIVLIAATILLSSCTNGSGPVQTNGSPAFTPAARTQEPDGALPFTDLPLEPSSTPFLPPAPEPGAETRWAVYHPDPPHLWNRLFRQLFGRTASDGAEYGWDTLDPLLWPDSSHLFEETAYQQTTELLDEFLAGDGARLIDDPLKRAILQRDLWAVFDWLGLDSDSFTEQREALQTRIIRIIRSLALTEHEIADLPANYHAAVLSGAFPESFKIEDPGAAFLPAGLFNQAGDWICLGREGGPIAMAHTENFPFLGRSIFLVFMRVPGDREAGLAFVRELTEMQRPALPAGLEVALVRQALLIDVQSDLVPSPIVESVQLRQFDGLQRFYNFGLDRKLLFAGVAGGLLPLQKEFLLFFSHGDPFQIGHLEEAAIPAICIACHTDPGQGISGITSILSFSRARFLLPDGQKPVLTVTSPGQEAEVLINWKVQDESWHRFMSLWSSTVP